MKTTRITKQHPNPTTPDAAERIAALQQRIRDKIDNQLVNMLLDNLGNNLHIVGALYRAYQKGCSDTNAYWGGADIV